MKSLLRQGAVGAMLLAALLSLLPSQFQAQESGKRRLIERTAPAYPALARNMALEGVVKVDALVAPDGSVKTVDVKGGHPVLAQAAATAVKRWRWEAAGHDSHEVVEIRFTPNE
jgi:TonB family protein